MESLLAFNLQSFVQAGVLIGTILMGFGAMRTEIKSQGNHLDKLDIKVDKLETAFIQLARQDERLGSLDQRMLAQGKRLDRLAERFTRSGRSSEEEEG